MQLLCESTALLFSCCWQFIGFTSITCGSESTLKTVTSPLGRDFSIKLAGIQRTNREVTIDTSSGPFGTLMMFILVL